MMGAVRDDDDKKADKYYNLDAIDCIKWDSLKKLTLVIHI